MPTRDPPPPTGFPPVTPQEAEAAAAARDASSGSTGAVAPDAVAIVRRHRARIAGAAVVSPEIRRVALDILDAILDDLHAPREAGSRT